MITLLASGHAVMRRNSEHLVFHACLENSSPNQGSVVVFSPSR